MFARYAGDPEVTKYLGWPRHQSVEQTEAFVLFSAVEWERDGVGPYLIRARAGGRLLGGTGIQMEEGREAVTGYVLAKDAWGQGFATEALAAMVELARAIAIARLSALCHPDHRASWRVLEKCGLTRRAGWSGQVEFPNLAPGRPCDTLRYEIVP
jgi:RimJ/RimL family protein N-acetyltransferase